MQNTTKLENLPLHQVKPSPTNPRKIFDAQKTQELADSIKSKGVMVPIMVRPQGKHFEIVYGERRWRASKLANMDSIPATIKELTDQDVREMQLIENFQREDVHPMEEAVAIFAAIKTGQYSIQDLALKVGKSSSYIAGRYKLNDLIQEFQSMFFENKISLKDALQLTTISAADQKDFFKEAGKSSEIRTYQVQNAVNTYHGRLDTAAFSLEDPQLNPEMGACTTCLQNSNNANLLFMDKKPYPVCMNSQCFKAKNKTHYASALKEALADPTIVTVTSSYFADKKIKDLETEKGITVLTKQHVHIIDEPELEPYEESEFDNKKEFEKAKLDAQKDYERELEEYHRKIASGRYKKAFVVEGTGKGAFVYVELDKAATDQLGKNTGEPKTEAAELTDIDEEIERLNDEEESKRKREDNGIWDKISELLTPGTLDMNSPHWQQDLTTEEMAAVAYELIGLTENNDLGEWAASITGVESDAWRLSVEDLPKLKQITAGKLLHMIRLFLLSQTADYANEAQKTLMLPVLKSPGYLPEAIAAFEKEIADARTHRNDKITKRIEELWARKLELQEKKKFPKAKGLKQLVEGLKTSPSSEGPASIKPQLLKYVSYKKVPGKQILQLQIDIQQINVKGDWLTDPATLDHAENRMVVICAAFNEASNIGKLKVIREDDCVYINHRHQLTDKITKLCGFELLAQPVAQ